MVDIKVICGTPQEMFETREKIHKSLAGDKSYIESNTCIMESSEDNCFHILLGYDNENDIYYKCTLKEI